MILSTALALLMAAAQPSLRKGFSGHRALGRRLGEAVDAHLWPAGKPKDEYAFVAEYTDAEVVFELGSRTLRARYEDDGVTARIVGQPEAVVVDYVRLEKARRSPVRGVELGPVLGPLVFEAQGAALAKGAGHKYLRRVPTGNPKRPWKYIYSVAAVTTHHEDEHFGIGAKFQIAHAGKTGHFEIIGRDGDTLRIKHDESGHETELTVDALKAMMAREHAHLVDAHRERLKRDLATARKHGTAKQVRRLLDEAKRHGHGDLALTAEKRTELLDQAVQRLVDGGTPADAKKFVRGLEASQMRILGATSEPGELAARALARLREFEAARKKVSAAGASDAVQRVLQSAVLKTRRAYDGLRGDAARAGSPPDSAGAQPPEPPSAVAVIEAFAKQAGDHWAHHVTKLPSGTELHRVFAMAGKSVDEGVFIEVRPNGRAVVFATEGSKRTPLAPGDVGARLEEIDGRIKRGGTTKRDPLAGLDPEALFTGDAVGLTEEGVEAVKRVRMDGPKAIPAALMAILVDEEIIDASGQLTRAGSGVFYQAQRHHEDKAERAKWKKDGVDGRGHLYGPVVDEHMERHRKAAKEHRREARNHPSGSAGRSAHLAMANRHQKRSDEWDRNKTAFAHYPKNREYTVEHVAKLRAGSEALHESSKATFQKHAADGTPWAAEREALVAGGVRDEGPLAKIHAAAPTAPVTFKPAPRPLSADRSHQRGRRFVTRDKARPNLAGVYYSHDGKAVSTDGHRMALIPVKDVPPEWIGTVRTAKGATGRTFPKSYVDVIPTERELTHSVTLDAAHLRAALKAVRGTLAGLPKKGGGYTSELRVADGKAVLYTPGDAERGVKASTVSLGVVDAGTAPFKVALDPRFLQDAALGARGAVRIRRTAEDFKPVTVERTDGEFHVIMPRR